MVLTTTLIIGAGLVLVGFLVKIFPELIAGYNTMSAKEKAKVDIDGLSSMMRNTLIIMGVLVALSQPLMTLLDLKQYTSGALITIVLFSTFFMVLTAQKFKNKNDRSPKNNKWIVYTIIGFAVFGSLLFGSLFYGASKPEIKIVNQQLYVSGIYSVATEVESLALVEVLPKILKRTNGYGFGSTFKGNFKLQDYGKAKLYLESLNGPYILVKTKNGTSIFINTKTKSETIALLDELSLAFQE
jgi:uncharacterized protein DUF3784